MAAFAHSENSTNVRPPTALSGELIEQMAVALFKTPRRGRELPAALDGARIDVTVGEQRLATWSWSPESHTRGTVLLVHGWNGHAGQLRAFVDPLVSLGYRVVAFDLPAHARSSGERAHVVDFAGAVTAIAEREGATAIIAHSLGATASALATVRGLSGIERLVLLAPPAEVEHFARGAARLIGLSPERADGMLARIRGEVGDLAALDLRRLAPALPKLFVMHDPEDKEVPFEHGRSIAEGAPDARFEAPFGIGHRGMLRDPQLIDRIVGFVTEEV